MSLLDPRPLPGWRPFEWRAGLTLLALAMVSAPLAAQAQEAVRAESDGLVALEIDGVTLAQFQEVSGVEAAGGMKGAEITLKRGTTDSRALMRWHEAGRTRGAASARKNGSIVQYDTQGRAVHRWNFTNAWPSKWEGPAHKAGAGEALESVTLEVESIRRAAP